MRKLPWLRIDRTRIYALGSSMGGQETALLVARHPHLLAGAAAMDSVTDLSRRYYQLADLPCDRSCLKRWGMPRGRNLQSVMRREVGGTPETNPRAYASRSSLSLARAIADSGVPLQIWWSANDRIVSDQKHQSRALFLEVRRLNRCAPVTAYAGHWKHSTEMRRARSCRSRSPASACYRRATGRCRTRCGISPPSAPSRPVSPSGGRGGAGGREEG